MAPRPVRLRLVVVGAVVLAVAAGAVRVAVAPPRAAVRATLTAAWKVRYRVAPPGRGVALARLHREAYRGSLEQCAACHGDKRASKLPVHRIHLRSPLLPGLACHECHPRVELGPRGNTSVITWVDVGFCKRCHSAYPGLHAGSRMSPADFEADCTRCHTGDRAPIHASSYLARDIPASECKGCHGARALPWTSAHERADWLRVHGAEALSRGSGTCFACHAFGLKFCDGCHAKKPPSHSPAEAWREAHPAAARAETRACYTCHRTTFCKGCHLDHETGWMRSHPAFVREHGEGSCTECHSLSSCTYCHAEPAVAAPTTSATGGAEALTEP